MKKVFTKQIALPVYNRNAFPARTLPALPARWLADACETGTTTSDSETKY